MWIKVREAASGELELKPRPPSASESQNICCNGILTVQRWLLSQVQDPQGPGVPTDAHYGSCKHPIIRPIVSLHILCHVYVTMNPTVTESGESVKHVIIKYQRYGF